MYVCMRMYVRCEIDGCSGVACLVRVLRALHRYASYSYQVSELPSVRALSLHVLALVLVVIAAGVPGSRRFAPIITFSQVEAFYAWWTAHVSQGK